MKKHPTASPDQQDAPDALVCFVPRRPAPGRLSWLGKTHCFVLRKQADGAWIGAEWHGGRLVFRHFPQMAVADLAATLADGETIMVATRCRRGPVTKRPQLRLMSCVELVKQALGLTGFWPLTAAGLYDRLISGGGRAFS